MMIRTVVLGGMLCAALALAGCSRKNKDDENKPAPVTSSGREGVSYRPPVAPSEKGEPEGPIYKTPQECFDALSVAENKDDYKTYVACYAPASQRKMAGELAVMSLANSPATGKDAEELAKLMKPVTDALAKHGLSKETTKGIQPGKDPEERQKAEQALLILIKDPASFVIDMMTAMKQAWGGKGGPKAFTKTLTEVKIDGDKATGVVVTKTRFSEEKKAASFVKIANGWRMLHEPERKNVKKDDKSAKEVAPRSTVVALTKELRANAEALNKKYEGKLIEMEGFFHHSDKDLLSSTVALVGVKPDPDDFRLESEVSCEVSRTDKSLWLGQGQKVKVVGRFLRANAQFGGIYLKDCLVTALEPNPTPQVTAPHLAAEFAKGEDAVRKKYFGEVKTKEFIVQGTVADVKKGMHDGLSVKLPLLVILVGSDNFSIDCQVNQIDFKAVKKGDKVKIKGTCPLSLFDEKDKRVILRNALVLEKD